MELNSIMEENNTTTEKVHNHHTHDRRKSKSKTFKSIFVKYFKTSSVRGFPKIVTSDSLHLRVTWGLALITLVCVAGFTVYNVIHNYAYQDVVLKFRTLKDGVDRFPVVSVCDTLPFTPKILNNIAEGKIPGLLTPKQYREWVIKNVNFSYLNMPVAYLATPITYMENIELDNIENLSANNSDFIVFCFYTVENSDGIETRDTKCRIEVQNFGPYNMCYRIHPIDKLKQHEQFIRLQFYVMKEPLDLISCHHCILEAKETLYDGVYISLLNLFPLLNSRSARTFQTGHHVKFSITPEYYIKSTVNHKCLEDQNKMLTYYQGDNPISVPYNSKLCWFFQLSDTILDKCGCVVENFPSQIPATERRKYPRCLHFMLYNATSKSHYLTSHKYIECIIKHGVDKYFYTDDGYPKSPPHSSKNCLPECSYLKYKKEVHKQPIVSKSSYLEIYKEFRQSDNIFAKYIQQNDDYDRALDLLAKNRTAEARQIILNSSYEPLDKFIFIQIERHNEPDVEYREEFVMGIYDAISQIGGALSVWSGVTVVCIFEMLELYYWIIQYLYNRARSAAV